MTSGWAGCVEGGVVDAAEVARRIAAARAEGRTLSELLTESIGLTLADAYRVQAAGTRLRLARGEHLAGWKLGATSQVKREQSGIAEPNLGALTDAMLLASGASVPSTALQPRVEPEIGLRLARDLHGPCSVEQALVACESAVACLEVIDSVWTGYRSALEDNTADDASAGWVVVGEPLPLDDLAAISVTLSVEGSTVAAATAAAAWGNPLRGLVWLVGQMALHDATLRAGDLVITGGLTATSPLVPGSRVAAVFWVDKGRRASTVTVTR